MLQHGSCAASGGAGVLFLGAPGAGKSDLLLRLMQRGWQLVADDQVALSAQGDAVLAEAPAELGGMLEVRGVGIFQGLPHGPATLRLAVLLVGREEVPRLPEPRVFTVLGRDLPLLALHAFDCSASAKIELALGVAEARYALHAGALSAA
ncbi:HPr kinase/phosphorylase [Pseudoroseomonas ludipueritiae]|uniref:Aldolase n=1 Tax=Pseudoroseomonas ludipueritiae TaxID=198093 RepID=A0ABR7RB86_9PROT|nr:aldolase [Pseudoroseomonas ludipueritiae]MBC9179030.1 aldolase [Pseudoroseomonas ludipueritiae]